MCRFPYVQGAARNNGQSQCYNTKGSGEENITGAGMLC